MTMMSLDVMVMNAVILMSVFIVLAGGAASPRVTASPPQQEAPRPSTTTFPGHSVARLCPQSHCRISRFWPTCPGCYLLFTLLSFPLSSQTVPPVDRTSKIRRALLRRRAVACFKEACLVEIQIQLPLSVVPLHVILL